MAAREVFAEKGFAGASVEDVCERAGFTRGAFYSNFGSKEALVLRLFDAETDALLARIEDATEETSGTLADVVERALGTLTSEPDEVRRRHLLRGEFALHALRHPAVAETLATREEQVRRRLAALVESVVAQHGRTLQIPAEDVAHAVVALHDAGVTNHLLRPQGRDIEAAITPWLVEAVTRPTDERS